MVVHPVAWILIQFIRVVLGFIFLLSLVVFGFLTFLWGRLLIYGDNGYPLILMAYIYWAISVAMMAGTGYMIYWFSRYDLYEPPTDYSDIYRTFE